MRSGDNRGLPEIKAARVAREQRPAVCPHPCSARCRHSLSSLAPTWDFLLLARITADTFYLHSLGCAVSLTRMAAPGGQGLWWPLLSPPPPDSCMSVMNKWMNTSAGGP